MVVIRVKKGWSVVEDADYVVYKTKERAQLRSHFLKLQKIEERERSAEVNEYIKNPKSII